MIIDVFVYAYQDEASAREAHGYIFREDETFNYLFPRVGLDSDPRSLHLSGASTEGLGDDAFAMAGEIEPTLGPAMPISIYFMRSGSSRAEVVVLGASINLDHHDAARNQFLRLARPDAVVAP